MGINDRDYMRRRPKESRLDEIKSSISDFYDRHTGVTIGLVAGAIVLIVILIKG